MTDPKHLFLISGMTRGIVGRGDQTSVFGKGHVAKNNRPAA